MNNKKFLFGLLIISASTYISLYALSITEIMYDPQGSDTGREWVEIYNDTGSDVDIKAFKFFENNVNHGLVSFQGGTSIPPNEYAVIADSPAKFLVDFPSYKGILVDSSFSLTNSGEYIAVKDDTGTILDSITYSSGIGGNDDGTTLSLINGTWSRGDATPGRANTLSTQLIGTTLSSSDTGTTLAKLTPPAVDLTLVLPDQKVVLAGAPADFSVRAITSEGKTPDAMTYTWSFGDGGEAKGKSVMYKYHYPGTYIATVEGDNGLIESLSRTKVQVVAPDVKIKNASRDANGLFVDVENATAYELDFSQWKVVLNGLMYSIPKNTFIAAKSVTRLSGEALGIATSTIPATTTLAFPDGFFLTNALFVASTSAQTLPMSTVTTSVNNFRDTITNDVGKVFSHAANTLADQSVHYVTKKITTENLASTTASSTNVLIKNLSNASKDSRIVEFFKKFFGW